MKAVKVYFNLKIVDPQRGPIYYSQRAGGPYYRWRYEEVRGEWLGSRMHANDLSLTELVSAPWKDVPDALKSTLDQHYVE